MSLPRRRLLRKKEGAARENHNLMAEVVSANGMKTMRVNITQHIVCVHKSVKNTLKRFTQLR